MDRSGWIIAGLAGGIVLGFALMGPVWGGMHHSGDWEGTGMWGWGWGMGLMMVLVWVAVIAAVVWLVRSLAGAPAGGTGGATAGGTGHGGGQRAMDILDERLARGEISVDEHRALSEAIQRR